MYSFICLCFLIDQVAKPTISCKMIDGSNSNTSAVLMCAEPSQPESLIKFKWSSHGNVQPGSQLEIPLGGELDDEVYSCTVSNPLSRETATFTAKDCYSGKISRRHQLLCIFIVLVEKVLFSSKCIA